MEGDVLPPPFSVDLTSLGGGYNNGVYFTHERQHSREFVNTSGRYMDIKLLLR